VCENTNGAGPMEKTEDGYFVYIRVFNPRKCRECPYRVSKNIQAA
jgi:hypothetical protein